MSFRPLPDLAQARTTPAFSFLVPNLCNDGHDAPCVTGAPGGLAQADALLALWVPKIMAAPAYRDGGLIVVTFDEGSDAAACCGETSGLSPAHPNVPLPGKTGPGGGRIVPLRWMLTNDRHAAAAGWPRGTWALTFKAGRREEQ